MAFHRSCAQALKHGFAGCRRARTPCSFRREPQLPARRSERTCSKEIDAFPIPLGEDEVVKSMVLAVVKVAL